MNITIIPPQTEMPIELQFQPYQFTISKHSYEGVVSATTEIAYEDSARMGVIHSSVFAKHQRWVPAFATDNAKLKAVILERERLHNRAGAEVRKLAIEDKKHQAAILRAGSYRAYLAGIAYRSWQLRQDSVAVAIAMDISPVNVRQHLFKMVCAARYLGFECTPPRESTNTLDPVEREMRLWEQRQKQERSERLKFLASRPEWREGFCWDCRVNPVDKSRGKWRCSPCQDEYNRRYSNKYYRRRKARRAARKAA